MMHKISHLEGLLRDHINMTTPTHRQYQPIQGASPLLSPPQDAAQSSSIEGGRLTQSPSGHVRYVSQASVLESTGWPAVTDVHQSSPTSLFNFPFSADPATSRQQLLDLLPPMSLCDRLKDLYMAVFSPLFHILHDPSFEESYRRFREDPATTSLTFLALLFVIFAIATMAVADDDPLLDDLGHEPSPRSKVKRIGAKFQSSSMKCLAADGFMWQHNLDTVKTLVLIIYSFSHTSGSAWSLLGATLNIAVAVGCHVDPIRLGTSITIVQAEERRRCWA
ncbi:MAG: fungal specific transcription factor domain-containing protein, partial [Candidatus Binatia bacterium]